MAVPENEVVKGAVPFCSRPCVRQRRVPAVRALRVQQGDVFEKEEQLVLARMEKKNVLFLMKKNSLFFGLERD